MRTSSQKVIISFDLNMTSLSTYLVVTNAAEAWSKRALELGYRPPQAWARGDQDDSDALLRTLLERFRDIGISSINELHHILADAEEWGTSMLRELRSRAEAPGGFTPYANPHDTLHIITLLSSRTLAEKKGTHPVRTVGPLIAVLVDNAGSCFFMKWGAFAPGPGQPGGGRRCGRARI